MFRGGLLESCRRGFVLKNRNGKTLARYGPSFYGDDNGGWPDWSTALNARGIALLKHDGKKEDRLAEEACRDKWPTVVLDDDHDALGVRVGAGMVQSAGRRVSPR